MTKFKEYFYKQSYIQGIPKACSKLNMLVGHTMTNKIYIGTCVQYCKRRPLEGDVRQFMLKRIA